MHSLQSPSLRPSPLDPIRKTSPFLTSAAKPSKPKNDRRLDYCLRDCLVAGKKALEDADLGGEKLNKIDKIKAGVLVGTGMGGLTVFSDGVKALIEKGHRKITPFFIPYAITNMGSALLAIDLGLMGPNYSISTACATSNYCFYAAANHIRRGEADMMHQLLVLILLLSWNFSSLQISLVLIA